MRNSLLAILTLGIFSLTPSSANALDLEKESKTNNSCVQKFGDGADHFCITSSNRVIRVHGTMNVDLGKFGGAENREGLISQYGSEDGKFIKYTCKARDWYALECTDKVVKYTYLSSQGFIDLFRNESDGTIRKF